MNIQQVAEICHTMNRFYCIAIGDLSQPEWKDAPSWQRSSAIAGVEAHLANPDMTPEESHKSWVKQKLAEGWVWGPNKDPKLKEHPCIVPYGQLDKEQQVKDWLFKEVVDCLRPYVEQGVINQTGETNMNQEQEPLNEEQGTAESTVIQDQKLPEPPDSPEATVDDLDDKTDAPVSENAPRNDEG